MVSNPLHWSSLVTHEWHSQSNCSCDMHPNVVTVLNWLHICNAPLVLSWLMAVTIGLYSGYKFHKLGPTVTGSLSYSITFSLYAFMITSGLFVHCLFLVECGQAPVTKAYVDLAKIDASLTSCIAISFLYNALVDLQLLPERAFGTVISMFFMYGWIFYLYFFDIATSMNIYFTTVGVGCSAYVIAELWILLTEQNCSALGYLLSAGAVGGGSLWLFYSHSCWLCQTFGAWSVEGLWYYGSDAAMVFVALFVWNTRQRKNVSESTDNCSKLNTL